MSKRLLVLAQIVVTLASTHIKTGVSTIRSCLTLAVRLLVERSCFVEDGSAEVIESSLVVMHHHVALATPLVRHGKLWKFHTSGWKVNEGLINQLSLVLIWHLCLVCPLAAFCLFQLFHESFSIIVLALVDLLVIIWVLGAGYLSLRGCLTFARHVYITVVRGETSLVSTKNLYIFSHTCVCS